ncbi:MAG TPA: universal stress protein [Allocoleopsis sp.]
MIERILIAVAGLGKCEEMLKMLMEISSIKQATVTILHIVPPQITSDEMAEKLEEGGKILASAVQNLKLDPARFTTRLKQGDPKDIVVQIAEEENSDLIIMGSRGLSRIESILQNSVSQYVFQLTSRPMLLVKDDVYVKRINKVMLAYDGSDSAKESLKLALFLVRDIKGGQLLLTNITSGKNPVEPDKNPNLAYAISEAKKYGINYKCVGNSGGKPGEEICRLASELNADLLLIGSPERRPSVARALPDLDRLLGNSTSDYVRVYSPCPVLLTRTVANN